MGRISRVLAAVALASAALLFSPVAAIAGSASVDVSVDIGLFHDALSPYGEWVTVEPYGVVWRPVGLSEQWRPYTLGNWIYTDSGWTWVSDEPWGWGPYHYGRWAYQAGYGWVWLPGSVWAPAWVAWRYGDGFVGWAPLAPVAGVQVDFIPPIAVVSGGWSFVSDRQILAPHVHQLLLPQARVQVVLQNSRDVTRYTHDGGRIVARPFAPAEIERITGRPVPLHRMVEASNVAAQSVAPGELRVYRPIRPSPDVVQRAFKPQPVARAAPQARSAATPSADRSPGATPAASRATQADERAPRASPSTPRTEKHAPRVAPSARPGARGTAAPPSTPTKAPARRRLTPGSSDRGGESHQGR